MKRFFEEYGAIALAILAVLVLIAIVSPVDGKIKESLTGTAKGFDEKMTNGLNSSGFGFGAGSGGTEISGVTTGKVLTIEGKEYTVIENVQGTQYKVLATEYANSGQEMKFGDNNNYATSPIATYLDNDYYNGLNANIKNAIVETSIQQKVALTRPDKGTNSPTWSDETKDMGTHKVFLPSWEELTKAAGGTNKATLKTFNGEFIWLRDAWDNGCVFGVGGNNDGFLYDSSYRSNHCIRPAFVLDLSKVNYTVK